MLVRNMARCRAIQNDVLHVRSIDVPRCTDRYMTPRRRDGLPILSSRSRAHPNISINRDQLNFALFIYPSLISKMEIHTEYVIYT